MNKMPSTAESVEARNWLMENRPDLNVTAKGRISARNMEIYQNKELEEIDTVVYDGEFTDEMTPVIDAPVEEKKEGRIKKFFTPKAKPMKRGRAETTMIWQLAYSGLAKLAALVPGKETNPAPMLPVSRMMEFQSPAVGILIDESIKGTLVDKVAQPLARTGKSGEMIWAIIGPPLLVSGMMASPEMQPVLYPMLRDSLKSYMILAGPAIKKREEKEKKLIEQMGSDYEGDIDTIIQALFAPPPGMGTAYNGNAS